jgi:hypothetical protein
MCSEFVIESFLHSVITVLLLTPVDITSWTREYISYAYFNISGSRIVVSFGLNAFRH